MRTKREQVLDAAIELLGTKGSRGLTHRGVDEIAAMPTGSTSNYFRTRETLLAGVAGRLVERDHSDWADLDRLPTPQTAAELIDSAAALLMHSLGPERIRTAARYALFLEAAATEELQAPLLEARQGLVAWVVSMMAAVSSQPEIDAPILMDYLDGAILHQLTMPVADFDPRPRITHLVTSLL